MTKDANIKPQPAASAALPRPCDDEELERRLLELVGRARTANAKYLSDLLDKTSLRNVVLQLTEGSDVFDWLIGRHIASEKAEKAKIQKDLDDTKALVAEYTGSVMPRGNIKADWWKIAMKERRRRVELERQLAKGEVK